MLNPKPFFAVCNGDTSIGIDDMARIPWILKGLSRGENHPCWGCALGKVQCGVIIPFLLDVFDVCDRQLWVESGENLNFYLGQEILFSINSFALYCETGTSKKLTSTLNVTLYTVDGTKTEHTWTAAVPNPTFIEKRRGLVVLKPEIRQLATNDLYSPLTRELLKKLMEHLCVGSSKIHKTALRVMSKISKGNASMRQDILNQAN